MKIQIYTTPSCHYCKIAKEYFNSKSISFESFDITSNEEKRNEMIQQGFQSVPIIKIDDKFIVGWNQKTIESILSPEQ